MTQLDDHGARILAFVERYQRQHHRSPTYREIGSAVGLASSDHVARDLRRLVQQGFLSFTPGVSRSIVLLKTPRAHARPSNLRLPQLTPASAEPKPAADELVNLAAGLFENETDTFILRARGDAMRDAQLEDGDLVVVKQGASFQDGDLVAIYFKRAGRTTLKRLTRENGHLCVQPLHPDAPPETINASDIQIRGTVLAIIRERDQQG